LWQVQADHGWQVYGDEDQELLNNAYYDKHLRIADQYVDVGYSKRSKKAVYRVDLFDLIQTRFSNGTKRLVRWAPEEREPFEPQWEDRPIGAGRGLASVLPEWVTRQTLEAALEAKGKGKHGVVAAATTKGKGRGTDVVKG